MAKSSCGCSTQHLLTLYMSRKRGCVQVCIYVGMCVYGCMHVQARDHDDIRCLVCAQHIQTHVKRPHRHCHKRQEVDTHKYAHTQS